MIFNTVNSLYSNPSDHRMGGTALMRRPVAGLGRAGGCVVTLAG
jgi:hypothetical protein